MVVVGIVIVTVALAVGVAAADAVVLLLGDLSVVVALLLLPLFLVDVVEAAAEE